MKSSAGIILVRKRGSELHLLLGHMGGPFWSKKDQHSWTIPKGEFDLESEAPVDAARREFKEETGMEVSEELKVLPAFTKNNKKHFFFYLEKDVNTKQMFSNTFQIEWPPKSGKFSDFPELDRFEWCNLKDARQKLVRGQLPVLDFLSEVI